MSFRFPLESRKRNGLPSPSVTTWTLVCLLYTSGFIYHWMYQRWYRTLVDAKIYEQMKFPKPFAATGALGETDLDAARREAGER